MVPNNPSSIRLHPSPSNRTPRVSDAQRRLEEFRAQARRLLKTLRQGDETAARTAAARFQSLRSFAERTVQDIQAHPGRVRLKHALAVIARENDYPSWRALKHAWEDPQQAESATSMYEPGFDVLLNRWFAHYTDAAESLAEQGGFLLPYKSQFLICEDEGIRLLGLDPRDPDWPKIGWNWVQPADREAWQRLHRKRQEQLQKARP